MTSKGRCRWECEQKCSTLPPQLVRIGAVSTVTDANACISWHVQQAADAAVAYVHGFQYDCTVKLLIIKINKATLAAGCDFK